MSNSSALGVADGTVANGVIVTPNATFVVQGVTLGNEAVSIGGLGQTQAGALEAQLTPSSLAGPITLTSDTLFTTWAAGIDLTLSGVISGPAALHVTGFGTTKLTNSGNAFTGGVKFDGPLAGGTLEVDADQAIPGAPTIDLHNYVLRINGHAQTLSGLTGPGGLDLPTAASVLTINDTVDTSTAALVTGTGVIHHTGTANMTFTASSTFIGSVTVDHGTVTVSNGRLPATVSVDNDGQFSLVSGTSGPITITKGHLQLTPGTAGTSNSGNVVLGGGEAALDVNGSLPGTLPKLTVTGTVALADTPLNLHLPAGFAPVSGTSYTLINNDGTDAISGTFAGLPEGSTLTVAGNTFRISYAGGTGNDVTLTPLSANPDYLLTEGATNSFFTTDLLLANPNAQDAPVHIRFLKSDATTQTLDATVPASSHKMIRVNTIQGMENANFSTLVHSVASLPLVVERTMSWDNSGYGAHTEHATDGTATTWYFAEGSQGFFHTYLLLANPQATTNTATVQYLREGTTPLTRTYQLEPTSRFTVDAGADRQLVNQSFGMIVSFDQPGAAERAMYFGDVPLFSGGHESAGVTGPSTQWFLAEGATGPFFETFVLLANPGDTDATATLTYLPLGGSPINATKQVPAHTRLTVNLEGESPALGNAAVSTQVTSTQPLLVERSQYWPDPAPNWYEAHNSFGVTALGTKWGLAEGRVGNVDGNTNAQTYILLANPGTTAANVTITFLRDDAATNVTHSFIVQPQTRFNVPVGPGTSVPELSNEHFGGVVTSDQPIAVERALYWDANGQLWAAGTNAAATPLP